jgi:hypothetical protein
MSQLTITLKFLRDNALVYKGADNYFETFEELDSETQGAWLEEALTALKTKGTYTLPARYNKVGDPLVLVVEGGNF